MASGRRNGSLVDSATEAIRSQIQLGKLLAGDKLPPERVLVEDLGVSRTVLREALSSLEALGLIETHGTRGRFVASGGSSTRSRSIVSAWLQQHAAGILEVDEIRSVVEAHSIRSMSVWDALDAAAAASTILREQADAIERGDPVAAADADAAFHRLLCSYTKNSALLVLIDGLIGASRKGAFAVYSLPETARRSLAQHTEIVEALAESDVVRASELASDHMIDAARQYATAQRGLIGAE
jgi:GntR family transcriptional regulator, transcriptional repressor for pyruvate dehydrogenase complex